MSQEDEWLTDRQMDFKAVWFFIGLVLGGVLSWVVYAVFK